MNTILIGNIVAFIASIIMVLVGLIKSKKKIIVVQSIQFGIQAAANLILGGITGFVTGIVSIGRNITVYFRPLSKLLKIIFIVVLAGISLFTKPETLIDWFPIISCSIYTWYIDLKDPIKFKVVILITVVFWIIYDFMYKNYTSFSFDIFTEISTLIGIIRIRKDQKKGRTNFD